jgi:hypothetical protein
VSQIKSSLEKAHKKRCGFKWVLMCSADPTAASMEKLEQLEKKYPGTEIKFRFGSEIRSILTVRRSICRQFYEETSDLLYEALDNDGKTDYVQSFARKTRLLNQHIEDDRFSVTVLSDGNVSEIQYRLQPWVNEPVPIVELTAKNAKAAKALRDQLERGINFDLSGEDVEIKELVKLFPDEKEAKPARVRTVSHPEPNESLFRLFSSKKPDAVSIAIKLTTKRQGTKELVRSNASQNDCPIVFVITITEKEKDGRFEQRVTCQLTPKFFGNKIGEAVRGAKFLYETAQSGIIGFSNINDTVSEASFIHFVEKQDVGEAEQRLAIFEEIKAVLDLFEIDPVLSDEFKDKAFVKAFRFFCKAIKWRDAGEFEAELSFGFIPNKNIDARMKDIVTSKGSRLVFCHYVEGFGYRLTAWIVIHSREATTRVETADNGEKKLFINGLHTVSITQTRAKRL